MPSSRGSSQPREWTRISYIFCITGRFFTTEPLGKPHAHHPCFWINGSPLSFTLCRTTHGPPVTRFHELGLLTPFFTPVKWLITGPPLGCVNNYYWDFFFFFNHNSITRGSEHSLWSQAAGSQCWRLHLPSFWPWLSVFSASASLSSFNPKLGKTIVRASEYCFKDEVS